MFLPQRLLLLLLVQIGTADVKVSSFHSEGFPSRQNMVEIFKDSWATLLPGYKN
jgi:hypothetical protein